MDEIKRSIGQRIKMLREKRGYSQEQLAKKVGYSSPSSRSTINKIELGINDIAQSKLPLYAKALHTTVAYLLGLEDDDGQTISEERLAEWEERCPSDVLADEAKVFEAVQEHFGKQASRLLIAFCQLNRHGKQKAIDTVEDLTAIDKYRSNDS